MRHKMKEAIKVMIKVANALASPSMLVCAKPVEVKSKRINTRAAAPKFEFVVNFEFKFNDDKNPTSPLNKCFGSHKANKNRALK